MTTTFAKSKQNTDFFSTSLIARATQISPQNFFEILIEEGLLTKAEKTYDLTERGKTIGVYKFGEKSDRWPVWPAELLCDFLRSSGHEIPAINYDVLLAPPNPKKAKKTQTPSTTNSELHNYKREAQQLRQRLDELIKALGISNTPAVESWIRGVGYLDEVLANIREHQYD